MAHLITAQRDVLLAGHAPDLGPLALVAIFAAFTAIVGAHVFGRVQHRFPDEV
jgi:ABC-type polysaccharide/polyol phosphate export permease